MYNFLVLGLVPGTNLQITFNTWLYAFLLAVIGFGLANLYQYFTQEAAWQRVPLHASQVHTRR
jgi:hypothetical protein